MTNPAHILVRPHAAFAGLRDGGRLLPLLGIVLAVDIALALLLIPKFSAAIDQQLAAMPAHIAAAGVVMLASAVAVGALANVAMLAFAALLLVLATRIGGGAAGYRTIFGVLLLSSVPTMAARLLQAVSPALGLGGDPVRDHLSFAALAHLPPGAALRAGMEVVSVFDLWTFALVALGFAMVSGLRRWPAVAVAVAIWGGMQLLLVRVAMAGAA
jgi:hypothetical protein